MWVPEVELRLSSSMEGTFTRGAILLAQVLYFKSGFHNWMSRVNVRLTEISRSLHCMTSLGLYW